MAIERTITHWTGGPNHATELDKKHYHKITEGSGRIVDGHEEIEDNLVTSDGDYAAHTRNLNTGSAGFAMAGMADAEESPFVPGNFPIRREQFEAHCRMLAEFHEDYSIPVTRETCLTHAEVEPTLGVKQNGKWDLTRLVFEPSIVGAIPVGDYMRKRVRAYMQNPPVEERYPTLQKGDRGMMVQELQALLADHGFFTGKQDGIFGNITHRTVVAFQADRSLHPDGIVGQRTWNKLMQIQPNKQDRNISEAELRLRGSGTIKAADSGQKVALRAGGFALVGTASETLRGASSAVTEAESTLGMLQGLLLEYWPLLLVLAAGGAFWYYMKVIKDKRVEDARTGRHMGR